MSLPLKYLPLVILVAAALGAYGARQFAPRQVTKTQVVDHDVIKDRIITVTKEITKPDGTKEVDSVVTDNRSQNDTSKTNTSQSALTSQVQPNWFVTAGAGVDATSIQDLSSPVYQLGVNRRVLGPIYVGAWGNNKSQVGIQLGLEF